MKKAKTSQARLYPKDRLSPKEKDLPATRGMLWLVRTELKEEMNAGFHQVGSAIAKISVEIGRMSSEMSQMRSDMSQMRSELKSEMSQLSSEMKSELARQGVLIEEQRADNRIVLEALTGQAQRQDRLERRMDEVENTVRSIAKVRPKGAGSSR